MSEKTYNLLQQVQQALSAPENSTRDKIVSVISNIIGTDQEKLQELADQKGTRVTQAKFEPNDKAHRGVQYAFIVGNDESYKQGLKYLGPLAAIRVAVWVSTQYAAHYKQKLGAGDAFKQWIRRFTAHNGKMGLNSSAMQTVFKSSGIDVKIPPPQTNNRGVAKRDYEEFANIANLLYGDTGGVNFKRVEENQIARQPHTDIGGDFVGDGYEDIFRGDPYLDNAIPAATEKRNRDIAQVERDNQTLISLKHGVDMERATQQHHESQRMSNERLQQQKDDNVIAIEHRNDGLVDHGMSAMKTLYAKTSLSENVGEHKYKIAIMAPFDESAVGAQQPSFGNYKTLTINKKQRLSVKVDKPYGMLVYNFTAGITAPVYFFQSEVNFFVEPVFQYSAANATDDDAVTANQIVLDAGGTVGRNNSGAFDVNLRSSGQLVTSSVFDYSPLLESVRTVAGGIRISKTSKSDTESGTIRVCYNQVGEFGTNTSIQQHMDKQMQSGHYRDFHPSQTSCGDGYDNHMFDVTYCPAVADDLETFYEETEQQLMQPSRYFPSDLQRTGGAGHGYVGCLEFAYTATATPRAVKAHSLFGPHNAIILFENVGGSGQTPMSFQVDTIRHLEGRPKGVAQSLEMSGCKLMSADSSLDLLRKHKFEDFSFDDLKGVLHDNDITFEGSEGFDMLRKHQFDQATVDLMRGVFDNNGVTFTDLDTELYRCGIDFKQIDKQLAGWGILEIPLIKDLKDIVSKGLHNIGQALNPRDILGKAIPFALEQIILRVTGVPSLARAASQEVEQFIKSK